MADQGGKIGEVYVEITADDSQAKAVLARFPSDMQASGTKAAAAAATATRTINASMAGIGSGAGMASHKIMQLGQTLDDLQYVPEQGLRPIINNVMQISPAIGIALIAVQTLGKAIMEAFASSGTGTEAEQMEELAKKVHKTADEYERLARSKRLEGKIDEHRGAMTKEEKKTAEAVSEAVTEYGLKNVVGLVKQHAPDLLEGTGDVPAAQKELERLKKVLGSVTGADNVVRKQTDEELAAEPKIIEAKQKLAEAYDRAAEQIIASGAMPDLFPANLQKLIDASKQDPNAAALTKGLEAATPEARQTAKDQKEARARNQMGFDEDERAYHEHQAKLKQDKDEKKAAETEATRLRELGYDDDERAYKDFQAKEKAKKARLKENHGGKVMDIGQYLNSLQSSGFLKGGDDPATKELKTHTELLKEIRTSTKVKRPATFGKR